MLPVQAEKEQAESHEYAEQVALMILACVGSSRLHVNNL